MATVEILGVRQPQRMPDILRDYYLDRPGVQRDGGADVIRIVGWAIGAVSRVVGAEITYRNRIVAVAPLDHRRPDVEATHPGLDEKVYGFSQLIDVSDLAPEFELGMRVLLEDGSRVAFGSIKGRHGEAQPADAATPDAGAAEREATKAAQSRLEARVAALIEAGLAEREPAPLGDTAFLARLDLRGRRVLVIGSGLGELARLVRARGAGLVDVLEPDADRARTERLITAHEDVTRVFFFDRAVGDPQGFAPGYGLALAPLGTDDLEPALEDLSRNAKVLVAPLPVSRGKAEVPDAVHAAFPHHEVLGAGGSANGGRSRATRRRVALAAERSDLDALLLAGDEAGAVAEPSVAGEPS